MMTTTLSLALLVFTASAPPPAATSATPGVRWIGASDLSGDLKDSAGRAVTVVDARGLPAFARGHIPGAVHVDWLAYRDGLTRTGKLPPDLQALAQELGALGIDTDRPVVVCADVKDGWGEDGRVAWMLRYLGHPDVRVLRGGCTAWADAGREMTMLPTMTTAGRFQLKVEGGLRALKAEVKRVAADRSAQILDVRTADEYAGATPYLSPRGGRLPGAKHVHFEDLLDETGAPKREAEVRAILKAAGVDPERPVITYCTGGVRSASAALVLRAHGIDAKNYDGSFWEWSQDETLPLETSSSTTTKSK